MEYQFSFKVAQGFFALPCDVVDQYIGEASAADLKVLLYVYRHGSAAIGDEVICKALELSPETLGRSLGFWVSKGLFTCSTAQASAPPAAAAAQPAPRSAPQKRTVETPASYSSDEVARKLRENNDLRFLLDSLPSLLSRLLSQAECSVFIYLYEGAGLPADVILMLVEYCVSAGHGNIRYIEKAGLSWAEDGVVTHELAESRILALEARRSFEGRLRTMMGISGRTLTAAERQHIGRWAEWELPDDMIRLAYEICVNRTGKLSFSYINSILAAWHEKGFKTAEQAKNEKQPKSGGGRAPSYDIDEYVDLSMKRLLND